MNTNTNISANTKTTPKYCDVSNATLPNAPWHSSVWLKPPLCGLLVSLKLSVFVAVTSDPEKYKYRKKMQMSLNLPVHPGYRRPIEIQIQIKIQIQYRCPVSSKPVYVGITTDWPTEIQIQTKIQIHYRFKCRCPLTFQSTQGIRDCISLTSSCTYIPLHTAW